MPPRKKPSQPKQQSSRKRPAPRRHVPKRPRDGRRRQRPHFHNNGEATPPPSPSPSDNVNDDIMTQLRLQRQQQQQQQEAAKQQDPDPQQQQEKNDENRPKKILGGYRFDEKRGAYFPVTTDNGGADTEFGLGAVEHTTDVLDTTTIEKIQRARIRKFPFRTVRAPTRKCMHHHHHHQSTLSFSSLEACSSSFERRRLIALQSTGRILQSCRIMPSATEFSNCNNNRLGRPGQWVHLFQPLRTMIGSRLDHDDLSGLIEKPAWTRTFDVWDYNTNEPPQILTTGSRGVSTRDVHKSGQQAVCPMDTVTCRYRSLPSDFYNDAKQKIKFDVVQNIDETMDKLSAFQLDYTFPDEPYATYVPMQIPMINDLCYLDSTTILLAALHRRGRTGTLPILRMRPGHVTIERTQFTHYADVVVPASDALCVQTDYVDGLACVGFRNGHILVTDRQGNSQSVITHDTIATFGSVHALLSIGNKQMLARGGSGECRLFDLRNLSSFSMDQTVVNEYVIPSDKCMDRLTRKCRGIATDPSCSTVISPFVCSDSNEPAVSMFSLHTGDFVGFKTLAPQPDADDDSDGGHVIPASSSGGVSWVELCPRVTSAWQYSDKGTEVGAYRRAPGSFALWFKTGPTFSGAVLPPSAGNIHSCVFNGRPSLNK